MNARDDLADVFTGHVVGFGGYPKKLMRGHAQEIATRILAAGYRKPRTITLWGVAFVHNGAFYKEYPTREDARKFADDMTEVGAHMKVVTREYVPAVCGEWEDAA